MFASCFEQQILSINLFSTAQFPTVGHSSLSEVALGSDIYQTSDLSNNLCVFSMVLAKDPSTRLLDGLWTGKHLKNIFLSIFFLGFYEVLYVFF